MKLLLEVDAGYYVDYLTILGVKVDRTENKDVLTQYDRCQQKLIEQIGYKKFVEIFKSKEYEDLYDVNDQLYQMVDLAKENKVTAKQVDDLVIERWRKKKALQEKFYPESEYSEIKVGYGEGK